MVTQTCTAVTNRRYSWRYRPFREIDAPLLQSLGPCVDCMSNLRLSLHPKQFAGSRGTIACHAGPQNQPLVDGKEPTGCKEARAQQRVRERCSYRFSKTATQKSNGHEKVAGPMCNHPGHGLTCALPAGGSSVSNCTCSKTLSWASLLPCLRFPPGAPHKISTLQMLLPVQNSAVACRWTHKLHQDISTLMPVGCRG